MSNEPPRPPNYRLRLPGPTSVPEQVRQAIAEPVINHRGPEFHAMFHEVIELARPLFGTSGEVLLFAASGTGVMEAAIANIVAPGERVLIAINGQFGERFKAIAEAFGAAVDTIECEWGTAPEPQEIARRLAGADYRAVFVTHNESSTGAVAVHAVERTVPYVSPEQGWNRELDSRTRPVFARSCAVRNCDWSNPFPGEECGRGSRFAAPAEPTSAAKPCKSQWATPRPSFVYCSQRSRRAACFLHRIDQIDL